MNARDLIYQQLDPLAALISQENGKPLTEAISADLMPVLELATYFAKNTEKILQREAIWLGKWNWLGRSSTISYQPLGVVGIIAPWNFPFSIPCGQVIMALMAGNTVVLKPSEFTPLVGVKIVEIFTQAGLPKDVLQVVVGDGLTGAALVQSGVDKISFTGSVPTGKKIMEAAAKSLTPVVLELGGKDPMVVLEDADLEVAAAGAVWGAFSNSGQVCASVERLYVHEQVAEAFIQKCVAKTQQLRQGLGSGEAVDLGAMNNAPQLAKVAAQVEEAKRAGAQVLTGGKRATGGKGYFYPPTILTGVNHQMAVVSDESFGPVLPIMTFKDEAEAIQRCNDSQYALTASVWTKDLARGQRIAEQIEAGTVMINENTYTYALPQTPWGGPKQSGIGRTHGKEGLLEFVGTKHIHLNRMARMKDLWWFHYDRTRYQLLIAMADMLFGKGPLTRVKGFFKMVWLGRKARNL